MLGNRAQAVPLKALTASAAALYVDTERARERWEELLDDFRRMKAGNLPCLDFSRKIYSRATARTYLNTARLIQKYCERRDIPYFPMSDTALLEFLRSPESARTPLHRYQQANVVHVLHKLAGLSSPCRTSLFQQTAFGNLISYYSASKRLTYDPADVAVILENCLGDHPMQIRDHSIVSLAFDGACDPTTLVLMLRQGIVIIPGGMEVRTLDPRRPAIFIGRQPENRHCSVASMERYLAIRGPYPGPLYLPKVEVHGLSRAAFHAVIRTRSRAVGVEGPSGMGNIARSGAYAYIRSFGAMATQKITNGSHAEHLEKLGAKLPAKPAKARRVSWGKACSYRGEQK